MTNKAMLQILSILTVLMISRAWAENIDPYDDGSQYAYGNNLAW